MVSTLLVLAARFRSQIYEVTGAAAGVYALSHLGAGAAWGGVAVCLLGKSLEADLKKGRG